MRRNAITPGVLQRNAGHYAEAVNYFMNAERLNPRAPQIHHLYWNLAYLHIVLGHDREGLQWADRALAAGSLPIWRIRLLLAYRAVAFYRLGDRETAESLAKDLNNRFPFDTWRWHSPDDPDSQTNVEQWRSIQDALKAAGNRDHLDPDMDFGVPPSDVLLDDREGRTPTTAPGVTTLNTEQLAKMLQDDHPLVIDTMWNS